MIYSLANLPYWILLGLGVVLFLVAISAGGGDDDLDLDGDSLLEVDADTDVDPDVEGNFGFVLFLGWLGVGKVPLILLIATDFSLWGALGWLLNILAGRVLGRIPTTFWGWGGMIFVVSLGLSLYVGSWIARPIGKLFAPFGQDASGDRILGCVGTVVSKTLPYLPENKVGQVDVYDADQNLVSVSAVLPSWAKVVPCRQQSVLLIDRCSVGYLAIAKDSSDEDKWLANTEQKITDSRNK
ncbi:MAG: DUF1449 domain-containing protein [Spirulinaceae cyanobacterium]